jgi:membrane protease YdiL (CAAX protease family)
VNWKKPQAGGNTVPAQNENSNIVVYVLMAALVSSLFYAPIVISGHIGAGGMLYVSGLMWSPALAAFLIVLFRNLGIRSLGFKWGGARYALLGYFIPIAYAGIAYSLIWIFGFGFFPDTAAIDSLSQRLGWHITAPGLFVPLYFAWVGGIDFLPSLFVALGEEIGWRGFLAPRLVARFGFTEGTILLGIIWAAWHLPLLLFTDYNSGTPWWFALPCFCALTVGLSIILTWLRLASNSVWPCAILHASHNMFIQFFFTPLTGAHGRISSYVIDEFGVAVPAVVLLFALFIWFKRKSLITLDSPAGLAT